MELVDMPHLGCGPKGLRVRVSYGAHRVILIKKTKIYEVQKAVW